jgi:alkylation response protein AidB-like acyl-CoA dehydrogenase
MDLGFGPQFAAFRAEVREFIAAHWPRSGAENEPPERLERLFRAAVIEKGYYARSVPRRYGGSEQTPDIVNAEIIREEVRRAGAPAELSNNGTNMLVPTLLEWGTEAQCLRFIPGTIAGEILWAQGFSEPGAGSDLASLRTHAELVGSEWVINGHKIWSTQALPRSVHGWP